MIGLPVVSPLFALSTTEATRLPACCRRDGKHHCMAGLADRSDLVKRGTQLGAPTGKCPYFPTALAEAHNEICLPTGDALFASLVAHSPGVAQAESIRRISRDRSHQKRGPPAFS